MGVMLLTSRAIIGSFYQTLEADPGLAWINAVSMLFSSDQEKETYKWMGNAPAMREWIGGRQSKGFAVNGIEITNLHYEATIEFKKRELTLDKTGQVQVRIGELARRANTHWAYLLSTLITNGTSTVCYDGQYFFDTDHSEGSSGSQSNSISVTIANLPVALKGSTTAPSVEQFQQSVLAAIQAIYGFKDDQKEPMNEGAREFLVMVPLVFWSVAKAALAQPLTAYGATNLIQSMDGVTIRLTVNPRLTWTTQFAVFRSDGSVKPFIRQEQEPLTMKAKAEGSEYEFDNDAHQYGIDAWRNVGYGYWQYGCLVTMA